MSDDLSFPPRRDGPGPGPRPGPVPGPGPLAREIAERLETALAPTLLEVANDSARHRGHVGDDGTGETHFTVTIEAAAFAGLGRLQRQRLVNAALGDIPGDRVHALAIRARAPGEAV